MGLDLQDHKMFDVVRKLRQELPSTNLLETHKSFEYSLDGFEGQALISNVVLHARAHKMDEDLTYTVHQLVRMLTKTGLRMTAMTSMALYDPRHYLEAGSTLLDTVSKMNWID